MNSPYAMLDLPENAKKMGKYLTERLEDLIRSEKGSGAEDYRIIKEIRGTGLIQGIKFAEDVKVSDICAKCLENGLVVVSAADNVLRLLPPLTVTKEDIDEMITKLKSCL